ncbi:type II toxin-antitoxin system RelE/ParE family toxin [bacterium]|nr:type II toxin-antitoxin system RelE/ParE family toxin [bacterium]
MIWKLKIRPSAKHEMQRLSDPILQRIISKIMGLKENPFPSGMVKLKMTEGYRIRVGDWRILYEIDKRKQLITVFAVRHRSKAYKL